MRRPSPLTFIVLLLGLCIGLVAWHYAARRNGNLSGPETGVFLVLRPIQRTLSGVGSWAADVGRAMTQRGGIIDENTRLRKRIAQLEGDNQRLLRYRRENEELRRLLKMPKPPGGKNLAAEVVSLDATSYARRIVLNVGRRHGVRPKDVVYTAQGVVGQVTFVGPFSSKVYLITDRESGVGAMTTRTMAQGVVQGTGERICKMEYLDFQSDVREGDLVVTSRIANYSMFPKGLVIGRVLKVEKNKTISKMTAYIDPAVPLDRITAVYVRTQAGR